ncbi:MAG: LytTR family DNA-binding domain-containing protein [Bacteroidota bacterium]
MTHFSKWNFKEANESLGWVLGVGVALGIANYAAGAWPTFGQSLVQQISISLVIGYGLVWIASNNWLYGTFGVIPKGQSLFKLIVLFGLVGLIGSEVEGMVRTYAFNQGTYQPFNWTGYYLFNCILSIILGFASMNWVKARRPPVLSMETIEKAEPSGTINEPLSAIPIKKGDSVLLYPLEDILYFEAYDNYAFLFDVAGNKHLCNYSLRVLGEKLSGDFLRVHRKYLINKRQLAKVQPHFKSRFVLTFKDKQQTTITSSTSYADVVKSLIKL